METELKFDASEFMTAMEEVRRKTNKTMVWMCRDVKRLWVQDLIKKTGGDPRVGMPTQKKMGEQAVAKDIGKAFMGIDNVRALEEWSRSAATAKGADGYVWRTVKGSRRKYRINPEVISRTEAAMESFHAGLRDKRGRVRFKKNPSEAWGGRFLVPGSILRAYAKQVMSHVGKTKAGWMRAATHFGATVPSWVSRHAGVYGSYSDTMAEGRKTGELSSVNDTPWIRDEDGMMNATLQTRLKDFKSGHYYDRLMKDFTAHSVYGVRMTP